MTEYELIMLKKFTVATSITVFVWWVLWLLSSFALDSNGIPGMGYVFLSMFTGPMFGLLFFTFSFNEN